MKPFMTAKEADRKQASHALACNPCPGRSPKNYQRVTRALDQIAARIRFYLEQTGYSDRKWLPSEGVVHEKDDEWQYDLYAQLEPGSYDLDSSGYMTDWHDAGIKATNRIVCITWYDNSEGDGFIIKKPVLCPLPCDQWGRLPITLTQWRRLAMTLIESEQLWRWVHAVRHYTDDASFKPAGIAGWHMEPTQAVVNHKKLAAEGKGYIIDMRSQDEREQDVEGWPGQNIYLDIIGGFSLAASEE